MSTSSSECDCDDYCQYKSDCYTNHRNAFGKNPYLPTTGHPLVYYAEMPQPRKQRTRERLRASPNCFVKAFRWYTKELVPNEARTKPGMTGFAAWLDTKYDEFLHDMDSEDVHLKIKETSVFEAERIPKNPYCDSRKGKKFIFRSPWTKRRRSKSNKTCNLKQTSNQSFQFIMEPKEMSRPASECRNSSNVTLLEKECNKKSLTKSYSTSNIILALASKDAVKTTSLAPADIKANGCSCHNGLSKSLDHKKFKKALAKKIVTTEDFYCQQSEQKMPKVNATTQTNNNIHMCSPSTRALDNSYQPNVEVYPLSSSDKQQECGSTNPIEMNSTGCHCKSLDTMSRNTVNRSSLTISRDLQRDKVSRDNRETQRREDRGCQCPEEQIVNVTAHTQYEEPYLGQTIPYLFCECDLQEFTSYYPRPVQSTSKINVQCPCEVKFKEELPTEKLTVKFSQNIAQTSNHSICLEDKSVQRYPLFMKIVCADKL